jgi:hypothetical protein
MVTDKQAMITDFRIIIWKEYLILNQSL